MRIETVAVIGAGVQGRDFALRCLEAGLRTVLEDVMPAKLRRAGEMAAGAIAEGRLELVTTVEDAVREADVAVDFVPDELESKLEIFSLIDRMAPPKTILATPTRALSVTDLASCTYRSDRCVGLRGGEDGLLGGPVGVVLGRRTSGETAEAVAALLTRLGVEHGVDEDREEPMLVGTKLD